MTASESSLPQGAASELESSAPKYRMASGWPWKLPPYADGAVVPMLDGVRSCSPREAAETRVVGRSGPAWPSKDCITRGRGWVALTQLPLQGEMPSQRECERASFGGLLQHTESSALSMTVSSEMSSSDDLSDDATRKLVLAWSSEQQRRTESTTLRWRCDLRKLLSCHVARPALTRGPRPGA